MAVTALSSVYVEGCFKKRTWEICPSAYSSACQSVVPETAASVSPRNILRMQILGPHPSRAAPEILGVPWEICVFTGVPVYSDTRLTLRTTGQL